MTERELKLRRMLLLIRKGIASGKVSNPAMLDTSTGQQRSMEIKPLSELIDEILEETK